MNYIQETEKILDAELPDCDPNLRRLYLLLVMTTGANTTLEDVHNAWAIWCTTNNPEHHSAIPFNRLSPHVQNLDGPYAAAIRRAAARICKGDGTQP
jgi:hypothetical protein